MISSNSARRGVLLIFFVAMAGIPTAGHACKLRLPSMRPHPCGLCHPEFRVKSLPVQKWCSGVMPRPRTRRYAPGVFIWPSSWVSDYVRNAYSKAQESCVPLVYVPLRIQLKVLIGHGRITFRVGSIMLPAESISSKASGSLARCVERQASRNLAMATQIGENKRRRKVCAAGRTRKYEFYLHSCH